MRTLPSPPGSASVYAVRRDRVIEVYRPILAPIVRRATAILPSTLERCDLDQIANLALVAAVMQFESYLRKRIRGAVLDAGRKSYQSEKCLRIDEFPEFESADTIHVDEQLDQARLVESMPALQRQVLEMRLSGFSPPEIAKATGVSRRTVIRRSVAGAKALQLARAA